VSAKPCRRENPRRIAAIDAAERAVAAIAYQAGMKAHDSNISTSSADSMVIHRRSEVMTSLHKGSPGCNDSTRVDL